MRHRAAILVVLVTVALMGLVSRPYLTGLAFVARVVGLGGAAAWWGSLNAQMSREDVVELPVSGRLVRLRVRTPMESVERTLIVIPDVHVMGWDEPRLGTLTREVAASGVAVITPDLPELSALLLTPAIVDRIEEVIAAIASQDRFAPDGRVGVAGLGLSGGLAVVAAGRPGLGGQVAYVVSVGGHGDLPRVLKYLCAGAPGEPVPRVDGTALILYGVADQVVPPRQVGVLRDWVARFLQASHAEPVNDPRTGRDAGTAGLPEPAARLAAYLTNGDIARLGSRLMPHVGVYGAAPDLSPEASPPPAAPVFLLHAPGDDLVPASESLRLADHLRGQTPVRLLLSGLADPTGLDRGPRASEVLNLASFWGDVLAR